MKILSGKVVSIGQTKAAVVVTERQYRHPLYGKMVRKKKSLNAANELGAKVGQTVKIKEVRPVSKTIHFRITEILTGNKEKGNK